MAQPETDRARRRRAAPRGARTDPRGIPWKWLVAAPLLAAAAYANALTNGLIWDDHIVVHEQLEAFRSVGDVFFPPAGIPQYAEHYYRPLVMASYLLDRALFGTSPIGFHASVVVTHVAATALVFLLAWSWLRGRSGAALAAAVGAGLFAVHPVHVEAVAWMAGRSETLAGLFALGALWSYARYRRGAGGAWLAASAIATGLALLAKETALAVLPLAAATAWLLPASSPARGPGRGRRPGRLVEGAAFAVPLLVYLVLRAVQIASAPPLSAAGAGELARRGLAAWAFYLERLWFPARTQVYVGSLPDGGAWLGFGLLGAAVWSAAVAWAWRRRARTVLFGLLWYPLTLAPSWAVAVVHVSETPLAERYLYLPSVALSLLVAAGAVALAERARPGRGVDARVVIAAAAAAALLVAGLVACVRRNRIWKDDRSFWSAAVAANPDEGLPHMHLGITYAKLGRLDVAERQYRRALDARYGEDGRAKAATNLAMLYLITGRPGLAERYAHDALELQPAAARPHLILGRLYLQRALGGRPATLDASFDAAALERARVHLQRVTELEPHDAEGLFLLADLHLLRGELGAALALHERVVEQAPASRWGEMSRDRLETFGAGPAPPPR